MMLLAHVVGSCSPTNFLPSKKQTSVKLAEKNTAPGIQQQLREVKVTFASHVNECHWSITYASRPSKLGRFRVYDNFDTVTWGPIFISFSLLNSEMSCQGTSNPPLIRKYVGPLQRRRHWVDWGWYVHSTFPWGCSWDWCRSGEFFFGR